MKSKVLLVDDDPDEVELLTEAFAEVSPQTICYGAGNGLIALNLLNSWNGELPDIILLDINMPVMNGWEFMQHIKRSDKLGKIPIIMYSTSGREQDRQMATTLGALRFIRKPDNYNALKKELESLAQFMRALFSSIWSVPLRLLRAPFRHPLLVPYRPVVLLRPAKE